MGTRIPVGGGHLDVEVIDGRAAPAVCITHPFVSMHEASAPVAEVTGRTVVSVNPRGVPPSSDPPDGRAGLEAMVEDLEAVRGTLGLEPWALWGMSGGGMVGQVYAHVAASGVAALILDSLAGSFRSTIARSDCFLSPRHPAWAHLGLRPANGAAEPVRWVPAGSVWVWGDDAGDAVVVSPEEPGAQMRRIMPAIWAHDATPWLAQLSLPTLVVIGGADEICPPGLQRDMAAAVLGARVLEVAGAGHLPVITHARQLTAPVRAFLDTAVGEG